MGNKWVGTVGSIKAAGGGVENAKQSSQQMGVAGFNPATKARLCAGYFIMAVKSETRKHALIAKAILC